MINHIISFQNLHLFIIQPVNTILASIIRIFNRKTPNYNLYIKSSYSVLDTNIHSSSSNNHKVANIITILLENSDHHLIRYKLSSYSVYEQGSKQFYPQISFAQRRRGQLATSRIMLPRQIGQGQAETNINGQTKPKGQISQPPGSQVQIG